MNRQEVELYNETIRKWSSKVRRKLHGSVLRFTKGKKGSIVLKNRTEKKLKDALGYNTYTYYGQVDRVGFSFERHGVFVHKGVGRGHIMSGGAVVLGRHPSSRAKNYAKDKGRNADDLIYQGPVRRKPQEWFNPILENEVPELADKIAELCADSAVNATRMRIN